MAKLHIRRTIFFMILGLVGGLIYAALTPKVYESTMWVVVGLPSLGPGRNAPLNMTADTADRYDRGNPRNPNTELQILRGRPVFYNALRAVSDRNPDADMMRDPERYYSMYDVLGERESDAVIIRARAYNPELAVQLATEVVEQYNSQRKTASSEAVQTTITYLDNQIKTSQVDLDKALQVRKDYMEQVAIADLPTTLGQETTAAVQAKSAFENSKRDLEAADSEVAAAQSRMNQTAKREDAEMGFQKTPVVTKLESDLAELKGTEAQLLSQYFEDHQSVRQIRERIKKTNSELALARKREMEQTSRINRKSPNYAQLELSYSQALIRRDGLRTASAEQSRILASHQDRLKELTEANRKLQGLNRDVEVLEGNLRNKKSQLEDIKNRAGSEQNAALVMGPAMPNPKPVFPDPLIVGLLSLFGGAALGLLYSFTVESLRLRIYTSYQLADLTGLPVMASLPKLPGSSIKQLENTLTTSSPRILESIRLLAFSLVAQAHQGCRKLLFTGLDVHTGSTSSASQLAIALGHTGAKVILVDADLVGRSASRVFKAEGQKGLAEALTAETNLDSIGEFLKETSSDNVKILPAGVANDRAVKESETRRLEDVLSWLSSRCDYLIFDTPPCLRNSEAARLAAETDEVFLVVSLRISTVPIVSAALDILRQAGANVVRMITTEGDRTEEALSREARVTAASRALPS